MIEVFATRKGDKCRLFVRGHAAPDRDRDAVCAGVSALVQSLVLYAATAPNARYLRYDLASGCAFFSCFGVSQAFSMALLGLEAIAREHPLHVAIKSLAAVDDK